MPPYAGFADIGEYIRARCRRDDISMRALSIKLGWAPSYLHSLTTGRVRGSLSHLDRLAGHFGDEPRVVRVLAGVDQVPAHDDKTLAAISDVARTLSGPDQRELLRYANYLKDKQSH